MRLTLTGRRVTRDVNEAIILSRLPKKWKWIVRDRSGALYLLTVKPKKDRHGWVFNDKGTKKYHSCWSDLSAFPYRHLFKCVKWSDSEPTNINRLLNKNLNQLRENLG